MVAGWRCALPGWRCALHVELDELHGRLGQLLWQQPLWQQPLWQQQPVRQQHPLPGRALRRTQLARRCRWGAVPLPPCRCSRGSLMLHRCCCPEGPRSRGSLMQNRCCCPEGPRCRRGAVVAAGCCCQRPRCRRGARRLELTVHLQWSWRQVESRTIKQTETVCLHIKGMLSVKTTIFSLQIKGLYLQIVSANATISVCR